MSTYQDDALAKMLAAIDATKLPAVQAAPLREALERLYADRPNAVHKLQAPLGRALRNPRFPGLWSKCVEDIPSSEAYADVRAAAERIQTFVETASGEEG